MPCLMFRLRYTRWFLLLGGTFVVLLGCGGWLSRDSWRRSYSSGLEIQPLSDNAPADDKQAATGAVEPPPIADLARRLRSKDEEERIDALFELAKSRDLGKRLLRQIVSLLDDKSLRVRKEAVLALLDIEGRDAIPVLSKYLETDPDPDFCGRIAGAISRFPVTDVSVVSCYIICFRREEESFFGVAMFAYYELIRRGEHAVPSLLKIIKDEKEKVTVRTQALDTLNRIAPTTEEAVSVVIPLLDDQDEDLSRLAAYGLGRIGRKSASARRALVKAAKMARTLSIRLEAARSLYRLDPTNRVSIPTFIAALHSESWASRLFAAHELAEIGPPAKEAVPALKLAIGDVDLDVRIAAVRALGRIGPSAESALPVLHETQNDPNPSLRAAVTEAIAKIRGVQQP